jgi:tRNA A37 methylthiotransferase MiaB
MKQIQTPWWKTDSKGVVTLYEETDLQGKVFGVCTACMSLYAEYLSWANHPGSENKAVKNAESADNIVFLCCQVTDLAVLNDLRTMERYKAQYPDKQFYVSGCLARRVDVELPSWVRRLDNLKRDGTFIADTSFVSFEKPFWVKNYDEAEYSEFKDGHFLRKKYPFRIGVGCHGMCAYCTIRFTRGAAYEIQADEEFERANDMVLIADSPQPHQLRYWMKSAREKNKKIAIRNVEPHVALEVWDDLKSFAKTGLLTIFHCPVQAFREDVLKRMGRDVKETHEVIKRIGSLGVPAATNIIIDYEDFPNDFETIKYEFTYVSWNPYWDGSWDRKKAEERFVKYFPWTGGVQ